MGGDRFLVRWTATSDELRAAVRVREQVFCCEQGVPRELELDGRDGDAQHLVALEPGRDRVIGTLRLLIDDDTAKVGRVAVERRYRRRGIATQMLDLALQRARERGCHRARLAAQLDATALYEQAGFSVESEPFEEAGIVHVWMGRALAPT